MGVICVVLHYCESLAIYITSLSHFSLQKINSRNWKKDEYIK